MSRAATWTAEKVEAFRAAWGTLAIREMCERFSTSPGALYRRARQMGLHRTIRRAAAPLNPRHRAMAAAKPLHDRRLVTAETSPALFVHGKENQKIGGRVTKGRWAGLPIVTLTLAERMTCPRSCAMWASCYGNNLNWPRRHVLDRDLIARMRWELTALHARHRAGFVVRLHVLGDFGSSDDPALAQAYAESWRGWLGTLPGLHVFGFTAWPPDSVVGPIVRAMNREFPERCRIRFSGRADLRGEGATVIETEAATAHVPCPQEMGRTESCGTCGLCWTMDRAVEFVRH